MAGYKFGNKANFGENTTLSGSFQTVLPLLSAPKKAGVVLFEVLFLSP